MAAIVPTAPPTPKFAARVDEAHMPTAEEKSADDYCPVGSKRKISFAPMVQIVLIPCLQEYREARILPSMFWSGDDLKAFRMDVLFSLQRYLPNVPSGTDKKVALRMMLAEEGCS